FDDGLDDFLRRIEDRVFVELFEGVVDELLESVVSELFAGVENGFFDGGLDVEGGQRADVLRDRLDLAAQTLKGQGVLRRLMGGREGEGNRCSARRLRLADLPAGLGDS